MMMKMRERVMGEMLTTTQNLMKSFKMLWRGLTGGLR